MNPKSNFWLPEDELERITGPKVVITEGDFGFLGDKSIEREAEIVRLAELNKLLDKYEEASKLSGMAKWFQPGTPFSIDKCPKHKEFFRAGADYNQRLFMAANRVGKSVSGALESAFHATG